MFFCVPFRSPFCLCPIQVIFECPIQVTLCPIQVISTFVSQSGHLCFCVSCRSFMCPNQIISVSHSDCLCACVPFRSSLCLCLMQVIILFVFHFGHLFVCIPCRPFMCSCPTQFIHVFVWLRLCLVHIIYVPFRSSWEGKDKCGRTRINQHFLYHTQLVQQTTVFKTLNSRIQGKTRLRNDDLHFWLLSW